MVEITAQELLAMPADEMRGVLKKWNRNKVGLHDVDWHFWRRDGQKPPSADWRVWLVMADRLASDHGGHFIAREFGGPEIPQNHFAQDAKVNKGEYRKLELLWKGELKRGRKVRVDIVPKYEGNSQRPHSLQVTYFYNGKMHQRTIPNLKGRK